MAGAESIVLTLFNGRKTADALPFPVGVEDVFTSGEYLVAVCLMSHVPDQLVIRGFVHIMESNGEFHHSQARTEVPRMYGSDVEDKITKLFRQLWQLIHPEFFQVVG